MRYMKALLDLPRDHCWTLRDWAELNKLDSKKLVEELQAPVEEVESVLFIRPEAWYTQLALPLSDDDLRYFVAKVASAHNYRHALLYASIFRFIFGRSAEDFIDDTHSWQDEWQRYQASIQDCQNDK